MHDQHRYSCYHCVDDLLVPRGERVYQKEGKVIVRQVFENPCADINHSHNKLGDILENIHSAITTLPRPVRKVCIVQLCAFMGWYVNSELLPFRKTLKHGLQVSIPLLLVSSLVTPCDLGG